MSDLEQFEGFLARCIGDYIVNEIDLSESINEALEKYKEEIIEAIKTGGVSAASALHSDSGNVLDEIAERIDSDGLAKYIRQRLQDSVLRFSQTPNIDGGGFICDKCYRAHGQWMSRQQGVVNENQILKQGTGILILGDLK